MTRAFVSERLVYLVGEPGVGKSTLARALMGEDVVQHDRPIAHLVSTCGLVEIGVRREAFSGTDGLSMSVHARAHGWMATFPYPVVLAEGDRLACWSFLDGCAAMGWDVHLVHVVCSPNTIAQRLLERGTPQNGTWIKGRRSKVRNLVARWADDRRPPVVIDTTMGSPRQQADELATRLPWLPYAGLNESHHRRNA